MRMFRIRCAVKIKGIGTTLLLRRMARAESDRTGFTRARLPTPQYRNAVDLPQNTR